MENRPYYEQVDKANVVKLRELISTLPPYVKTFFRGIEPTTASRTRIAYAYDLHVFFQFLKKENPVFRDREISSITLEELDQVTLYDLEDYMEYLKYYTSVDEDGVVVKDKVNKDRGIARKISSLKTFYNYFYRKQAITNNPAALISLPKNHEKPIIRLDIDEVAQLLDMVEAGEGLTKRQAAYYQKTRQRDLTMLTLLLGTGLRVSECVGLDIKDIDFKNDGLKVHRKGGKEVIIYFGDEVRDSLLDYIEVRKHQIPETGHEQALFLSMQNKRISVRSVENLVKKYTQIATPLKRITPHKLRSTYGTALYRETEDIYLVADVLGHSDVNTTKKHYAAIEDDRRRRARKAVRLREEESSYIETSKSPSEGASGSVSLDEYGEE